MNVNERFASRFGVAGARVACNKCVELAIEVLKKRGVSVNR